MSRRMACSMTVDAVRDRTKTVTRRHPDTWKNLEPGQLITLIEKGMGLAKGEKQVVLAQVEIIDVRLEPLINILDEGQAGCDAEGLPHLDPSAFVSFWLRGHPSAVGEPTICRRIEWRYLNGRAV